MLKGLGQKQGKTKAFVVTDGEAGMNLLKAAQTSVFCVLQGRKQAT